MYVVFVGIKSSFLFTDLSKVQSVIRGDFHQKIDTFVRQVDIRNMRSVLKEAKMNKWKRILVDLPVDATSLFLKMVRRFIPS